MVILLSIFNNLYSIILNLFFPVGCDFDEYAAIFTTQYDTSAQAGQSKLTTINPKQITTTVFRLISPGPQYLKKECVERRKGITKNLEVLRRQSNQPN